MVQQTRAQLIALKNSKILTGGNRTKAQDIRDMFDAVIDSFLNIIDDADTPGGFQTYPGGGGSGFVPLGGTAVGSPLTGPIEVANTVSAALRSYNGNDYSEVLTAGNYSGFAANNSVNNTQSVFNSFANGNFQVAGTDGVIGFSLSSDFPNNRVSLVGVGAFQGIVYDSDYSANYVANSLVQKVYVDASFVPINKIVGNFTTTIDNQGTRLLVTSTNTSTGDFSTEDIRANRFQLYSSVSTGDRVAQLRGGSGALTIDVFTTSLDIAGTYLFSGGLLDFYNENTANSTATYIQADASGVISLQITGSSGSVGVGIKDVGGLVGDNDYAAIYNNYSFVQKLYVDNSIAASVALYMPKVGGQFTGAVTFANSVTIPISISSGTNMYGIFYDSGAGSMNLGATDGTKSASIQSYNNGNVRMVGVSTSTYVFETDFANNRMLVTGGGAFTGVQYAADYSANYTARSLVDKGFVIGSFIPYTGAVSAINFGSQTFNVQGAVNMGNAAANGTALGIVRVGQGTSFADFGEHSAGNFAIWGNKVTNSSSNYAMMIDSAGNVAFNATSASIIFRTNGNNRGSINSSTFSTTVNTSFTGAVTSTGATTNFLFAQSANTGQTAATEIPGFKYTGSTRQWLGGNFAAQREVFFSRSTYLATTATTITDAYGLYAESPLASTNVILTNTWAAGFNGNVQVIGTVNSNGFSTNFTSSLAAISGFTNNLALSAKFNTGQVTIAHTNNTVNIATFDANGLSLALGNLSFPTLGNGLKFTTGTNARAGKATLASGTVTVSNTSVTSNTIIVATLIGSASGAINYTVNAGVGFTLNSTLITDSRVVSYMLIELV